MRLPSQLLRDRRATLLALRGVLLLPSAVLFPSSCGAGGLDEVRKAASLIPGYGPPDLLFPAAFVGRWQVNLQMADVQTPLGESAASAEALQQARRAIDAPPITFEARFVGTEDGTVIADRGWNAERRAAAPPGAPPLQELTSKWDSTNPNVLTLSFRGSVVETKVTKRSADAPFDGAFGTSEYARIADAGSSGVMGGVPSIMATRVQTRYKWDPASALPDRIDALELTETYDPTATGFADLAGATPVLKVKARLRLERQR